MTAIITVAIVFAFAVVLSVIYSADLKKKNQGVEVTVPDGEIHIVRGPDGKMSFYGVHEDEGPNYRRYNGDKVLVFRGHGYFFDVENENAVVKCSYGSGDVDIKVKVIARFEFANYEVMFAHSNLLASLSNELSYVVNVACLHTKLKELLASGINEVVAEDAILACQPAFICYGVTLRIFKVSDIRDAFGKAIVANVRRQIEGEQPSQKKVPVMKPGSTPFVGTKDPTKHLSRRANERNTGYPSLEEAVNPELEQFLKDDPYPLVLNG